MREKSGANAPRGGFEAAFFTDHRALWITCGNLWITGRGAGEKLHMPACRRFSDGAAFRDSGATSPFISR